MTPKNIPEQLRMLGFNTLAALIGTADLTNALQTPGPFTVFAPTDEAFEKFIGMDYVRDGEIQGRSSVFLKVNCPCILLSLT